MRRVERSRRVAYRLVEVYWSEGDFRRRTVPIRAHAILYLTPLHRQEWLCYWHRVSGFALTNPKIRCLPMKEWLAYAVAWSVLKAVGWLPRSLARGAGAMVARALMTLTPKLRKTAEFNLRLAFPDWSDAQREATIG